MEKTTYQARPGRFRLQRPQQDLWRFSPSYHSPSLVEPYRTIRANTQGIMMSLGIVRLPSVRYLLNSLRVKAINLVDMDLFKKIPGGGTLPRPVSAQSCPLVFGSQLAALYVHVSSSLERNIWLVKSQDCFLSLEEDSFYEEELDLW